MEASDRSIVLYNPKSLRGLKIAKKLKAQGFKIVNVLDIELKNFLTKVTLNCNRGNPKIIIISGGDGTASLIMEESLKSNLEERLEFLTLPAGTGNDLSNSLGITCVDKALKSLYYNIKEAFKPLKYEVLTQQNNIIQGYALNLVDGLVGYLITSQAEYYKKFLPRALAFPIAVIKTGFKIKPLNLEFIIKADAKPRLKLNMKAIYFYSINSCIAGSGFKLARNQRVFDTHFTLGVFQYSNPKTIPKLIAKALASKFFERDINDKRLFRLAVKDMRTYINNLGNKGNNPNNSFVGNGFGVEKDGEVVTENALELRVSKAKRKLIIYHNLI